MSKISSKFTKAHILLQTIKRSQNYVHKQKEKKKRLLLIIFLFNDWLDNDGARNKI